MRWPNFRDIEVSRTIQEEREHRLEQEDKETASDQATTVGGADVGLLQSGLHSHDAGHSEETPRDEIITLNFVDKSHCDNVEHEPSELEAALEVQNLQSTETKRLPNDGTIIYRC